MSGWSMSSLGQRLSFSVLTIPVAHGAVLLLLIRGRGRTEFSHALGLAGTELATSSRLLARLFKPDSNVFVAMWAIHNTLSM